MPAGVKPFPISHPVDVSSVAATPEQVAFEANAGERAALASFLGVPAVHAMRAEFELRRWRAIGVRVDGRVTAEIEQECVVTLEPVRQTVDESVAVRLLPAQFGEPDAARGGREVDIDPVGEDDPELFDGRRVDLGAIAVEHVALGLDPYPRAPGVRFDTSALSGNGAEDVDEPKVSPFAALERWKRER